VVKVIENPKFSPDVSRKYTIADMITGYGVAEAVRHYYETYGGDVKKESHCARFWECRLSSFLFG
jgi:hypothetical protein